MNYRYIIGDSTNPYKNLALEQALFKYAGQETVILYLWQNDNTIVIGKNQNVYTECKADEFISNGGSIARRRSGGGAVYHDMGNLNFSIICSVDASETNTYQMLVLNSLKIFNIYAVFNEKNDLIIEGKKFSGNASYNDGRVLCQHGTVLISSDIKKMDYYLTPDINKLERNHVKSVLSRVMNLSDLSENISIDKMKGAMIEACNALPLEISVSDRENREFISFYSSKTWIFGGRS